MWDSLNVKIQIIKIVMWFSVTLNGRLFIFLSATLNVAIVGTKPNDFNAFLNTLGKS